MHMQPQHAGTIMQKEIKCMKNSPVLLFIWAPDLEYIYSFCRCYCLFESVTQIIFILSSQVTHISLRNLSHSLFKPLCDKFFVENLKVYLHFFNSSQNEILFIPCCQ